jgi:hypothetical protein
MKTLFLKIFLLLLFANYVHVVNGQTSKQDIIINATTLHRNKDSISFLLVIKNVSSAKMVFFKPNIEYVNYGLMAIGLINQTSSGKFYFNHGQRGDIDNIFLKQEDYIILDKGESYTKQLSLAISEFVPRIAKGTYNVEFMLDYSIVNFTFPCEVNASVFKGKASTVLAEKIKL